MERRPFSWQTTLHPSVSHFQTEEIFKEKIALMESGGSFSEFRVDATLSLEPDSLDALLLAIRKCSSITRLGFGFPKSISVLSKTPEKARRNFSAVIMALSTSKVCTTIESIVVKWFPLEFFSLPLACQLLECCSSLRNIQLIGQMEDDIVEKFFTSWESPQIPGISLHLSNMIPSEKNVSSLRTFISKDKLHMIEMLVLEENSSYLEILIAASQSPLLTNVMITFRSSDCHKNFWQAIEGIWINSSLLKLNISTPIMNDEDFESMMKGISQAQLLECLEISLLHRVDPSLDFALRSWQILCKYCNRFQRLLKLQVQGFVADQTDLEINSPLVELFLEFSKVFEAESVQMKIVELIRRTSSLRKVVLVSRDLTSEIGNLLKEAISLNSTLEMLGISEVILGDDGIESLCSLIVENSSLTELGVVSCDISKDGLSSIAEALKKNKTLVKLTLEDVLKYSLEDVLCFIDTLKSDSSSLEMLNMCVEDGDDFVRLIEETPEIKLVEFNGEVCSHIVHNRKIFKQEARLTLIRRMANLDGVEKNTLWLIFEMSSL
jgi:hypothetical protein